MYYLLSRLFESKQHDSGLDFIDGFPLMRIFGHSERCLNVRTGYIRQTVSTSPVEDLLFDILPGTVLNTRVSLSMHFPVITCPQNLVFLIAKIFNLLLF